MDSSRDPVADKALHGRILSALKQSKPACETAEAATQTGDLVDSVVGLLTKEDLRIKPNILDGNQKRCLESMLYHNRRLTRVRIYT